MIFRAERINKRQINASFLGELLKNGFDFEVGLDHPSLNVERNEFSSCKFRIGQIFYLVVAGGRKCDGPFQCGDYLGKKEGPTLRFPFHTMFCQIGQ